MKNRTHGIVLFSRILKSIKDKKLTHTHINIIVYDNISLNVHYFLSFYNSLYVDILIASRSRVRGLFQLTRRTRRELKWFLSVSILLSRDSTTTMQYPSRVAFLSGFFLPRFGQIGSRHVFEFSMPNRPRLLLQEFPLPFALSLLFFLFRYRRKVCRSDYREISVSKTSQTRDVHVCMSIRRIRLLILNVRISSLIPRY